MKITRNFTPLPFGPILLVALVGLMSVATFLLEPVVHAQSNASWIPTGSLNVARSGHTATPLPDGKVLVVGGRNGNNSAELYDPSTGMWSITGILNAPRYLHAATLLADGKVLVVGGDDVGNSTELYDPATGTWSITGNLNTARFWHTATLLLDGKVLVAGGAGGGSSAELYDPATGTWSFTGSLIGARYGQTATLLPNGKVLVAGGSDDGDLSSTLASAELYDPATGTWSVTGSLNASRISHTATLLSNGKVLVAAGYFPNFISVGGGLRGASPTSLNGAELYDPATGEWSLTASLNTARDLHTATLLSDGKVLITAGEQWSPSNPPCGLTLSCLQFHGFLNNAELYDPATGNWSATAPLNAARASHTATLLANGKLLVAGGNNQNNGFINSVELYTLLSSISISDVTTTEGNVGTVNATFEVKLSDPSTEPVTVTFSTANRTAIAGIDFEGTSGALTFNPGETTKTITVVVNANTSLESNKSFVVNLTSATNAFLGHSQGVGTIINDDGALPQRLSNISTRSGVLTGDNAMIGGFIVDGSASKRVLVRSRGPSMAGAPFLVPGTLANPFVQVFSGQTVIAENNNWQDPPTCFDFVCEGATEIVNLGFDPCTPNPGQTVSPPSCALESAILITLPPGAYTAIVTGAGGETGVGLVEVFEADASTVSDLSNISTRGFVQSGDSVMIGGVIIEGTSPSTVLLRARGPSMGGAPFFIPGTLANPFLRLFSEQTVIAQNDNWQDVPSCDGFVCGGATEIAAIGLDPCQPNPGQSTSPPGCAQESAILITLPPGAYTAIVSGVGGATGVGLVEVFEVD